MSETRTARPAAPAAEALPTGDGSGVSEPAGSAEPDPGPELSGAMEPVEPAEVGPEPGPGPVGDDLPEPATDDLPEPVEDADPPPSDDEEIPPRDHLVWAVVAAVLCLPVGGIAVLLALQARRRWAGGDRDGARTSAGRARLAALWATVFGVATAVLCVVFFLVALAVLAWIDRGAG